MLKMALKTPSTTVNVNSSASSLVTVVTGPAKLTENYLKFSTNTEGQTPWTSNKKSPQYGSIPYNMVLRYRSIHDKGKPGTDRKSIMEDTGNRPVWHPKTLLRKIGKPVNLANCREKLKNRLILPIVAKNGKCDIKTTPNSREWRGPGRNSRIGERAHDPNLPLFPHIAKSRLIVRTSDKQNAGPHSSLEVVAKSVGKMQSSSNKSRELLTRYEMHCTQKCMDANCAGGIRCRSLCSEGYAKPSNRTGKQEMCETINPSIFKPDRDCENDELQIDRKCMDAFCSGREMCRSPDMEIRGRKLKSVGKQNRWKTDDLRTTVREISYALDAMHIECKTQRTGGEHRASGAQQIITQIHENKVSDDLLPTHAVNPSAPQNTPMPLSMLDGTRPMHTENATIGRERLERAAKMHTQVPERYTYSPDGQCIEPTKRGKRRADVKADLLWCRIARRRCSVMLDYAEGLCDQRPEISNVMVLHAKALLICEDISQGIMADEPCQSSLGDGWMVILNRLYEDLEHNSGRKKRCSMLLDYGEVLCDQHPAISNAMILHARVLMICKDISQGVMTDTPCRGFLGEGEQLYEELEQGGPSSSPAEGEVEDITFTYPGTGSAVEKGVRTLVESIRVMTDTPCRGFLGEGWREIIDQLYEELEQGGPQSSPAEGEVEDNPFNGDGKAEVIIGALGNDGNGGNGTYSGHVRVYTGGGGQTLTVMTDGLGTVPTDVTGNTGCGGQTQATKPVEMEVTGCGQVEEYVTGCVRQTLGVTHGSNAMPGAGYVRPGTTSPGAVADTGGCGQTLTVMTDGLGTVPTDAACNIGCCGQTPATKPVEMGATWCGEVKEYVTGCCRQTLDVTHGSNATPGAGYVRPGTTSTSAVADTGGGGQTLAAMTDELGTVPIDAACNTGCGGQIQATTPVEMEATGCGEVEEYVTGCGRRTWDVTHGSNATPGAGYVRPGTTSPGVVADTGGGGQTLTVMTDGVGTVPTDAVGNTECGEQTQATKPVEMEVTGCGEVEEYVTGCC